LNQNATQNDIDVLAQTERRCTCQKWRCGLNQKDILVQTGRSKPGQMITDPN